jgi:hypothetical protein
LAEKRGLEGAMRERRQLSSTLGPLVVVDLPFQSFEVGAVKHIAEVAHDKIREVLVQTPKESLPFLRVNLDGLEKYRCADDMHHIFAGECPAHSGGEIDIRGNVINQFVGEVAPRRWVTEY